MDRLALIPLPHGPSVEALLPPQQPICRAPILPTILTCIHIIHYMLLCCACRWVLNLTIGGSITALWLSAVYMCLRHPETDAI